MTENMIKILLPKVLAGARTLLASEDVNADFQRMLNVEDKAQ